jgi:hypothetical protein
MQTATPALGKTPRVRRVLLLTAALLSLLVVSAQPALAQAPLSIFKNYFVTGDYVVAGWVEGPPDGSGLATGTINVPDTIPNGKQPVQVGVPASVPPGADIVAAYLYWATVESGQTSFAGRHGFFNGYPIDGGLGLNPNAPTSWSSGGCSGASNGTKTMRVYRADVRAYLPIDKNEVIPQGLPNAGSPNPTFGNIQANGQFVVRLADSGSNGNTAPFSLGASLVIIYRLPAASYPSLNSIVIYDGAYAPGNTTANFSQNLVGFYQPAASPVSKITHIVANGQTNKGEAVYLAKPNTNLSLVSPLPSLYGNLPPFPGIYNTYGSAWDNPTWFLNGAANPVKATDTIETTTVVPSASNSGCVNWGAVILSTTVQSSNGDGLLDKWKADQGYVDVIPNANQNYEWVALPNPVGNANNNEKDLYIELDYSNDLNATVPNVAAHSHLPQKAALDLVGQRFLDKHIHVHFDLGPIAPSNYAGDLFVISPVPPPNPPPNPDPNTPGIVVAPPATAGGNAIDEAALYCNANTAFCQFPNQSSVSWKGGLLFVRDSVSITDPATGKVYAGGSFQQGRQNSYRYALFGHALGEARYLWSTTASLLNDTSVPKLISILSSGSAPGSVATITLQTPPPPLADGTGGMVTPVDCSAKTPPAQCSGNGDRVTIDGAL